MKEIDNMIDKELKKIIDEHGYFSSIQEFYAVLKEELEEAREEMDSMESLFNTIWTKIRMNEKIRDTDIELMTGFAIRGIKELVQVAAVLKKLGQPDLIIKPVVSDYEEAINIISMELRKDQTPGSTFYGWQANIACMAMDLGVDHKTANHIGIKFLSVLLNMPLDFEAIYNQKSIM